MKKYLLIPILLIATALTASAHCGACGANSGHGKAAEKRACATDCVKPCCKKAAACCAKGSGCCAKGSGCCAKGSGCCAKGSGCCKKDLKCTVDDCDKPKCDKAACAKKAAEQSRKAKKACCPAS